MARMEPTFGGIHLEDIKAAECFDIEQQLRERMKIPVPQQTLDVMDALLDSPSNSSPCTMNRARPSWPISTGG